MKTTEQIKSEVLSYLNQTSKHLFVNEEDWKKEKLSGERGTCKFYSVLVEGNNFIVIDGDRVSVYNIDQYISWYGGNTKCVIKHKLFLNKKLKSIKNFKTMREKISTIKEAISGKTDISEITKIATQLISSAPVVSEERKSFISKLFGK